MWRFENQMLGIFKANSPERIVDDGESEFEILHDSVDPAALRVVSGGGRERERTCPLLTFLQRQYLLGVSSSFLQPLVDRT